MKIELFYHLFIPPDSRGLRWHWMFDAQMRLITQARLHEAADLNLCVSMPMWWETDEYGGGFFPENGGDNIPFCEKVVNYVNARYPFIRVLEVRDISQKNLYEGQTLDYLHEHCQNNDGYVLYTHSKGMTGTSTNVWNWREVLDHFTITEWTRCIKHLVDHDVVCVRDLQSKETGDTITSGNVWWARNDYIRELPKPTDIYSYTPTKVILESERHAYELWIMKNQPRTHFTVDTGVNHYVDRCYVEDLINKR